MFFIFKLYSSAGPGDESLVAATWEAEAGCSQVQGQPWLHQPGQLSDILSQNKIKTLIQ